MTTTNTNLTRETILENAAEIMTRAHAITRKTCEQYPGTDYRATLADALRILWRDFGKTASEVFEDMTGEEQYTMVYRMTCYEYQHDERINPRTGQPMRGCFEWIRDRLPGIDVEDTLRGISHQAWIVLAEMLDNDDGETPLSRLTARAIHRAAARVQRAEYRHARPVRATTDPETGEAVSIIDTQAGAAAARMESPEHAAELDDLIGRACRDSADRLVIADRIAGYTQRETAALLDIGQRAVAKRLDGIRDRLAETIGRDPREKKAPRGKNARPAK